MLSKSFMLMLLHWNALVIVGFPVQMDPPPPQLAALQFSLDDKCGHLSKNPLETVSSGQFCSDCAMGGGGCSSRAPGAGLGSGVFSVSTPSLIFSTCSVKPKQGVHN